jgi:hypothetical protein
LRTSFGDCWSIIQDKSLISQAHALLGFSANDAMASMKNFEPTQWRAADDVENRVPSIRKMKIGSTDFIS